MNDQRMKILEEPSINVYLVRDQYTPDDGDARYPKRNRVFGRYLPFAFLALIVFTFFSGSYLKRLNSRTASSTSLERANTSSSLLYTDEKQCLNSSKDLLPQYNRYKNYSKAFRRFQVYFPPKFRSRNPSEPNANHASPQAVRRSPSPAYDSYAKSGGSPDAA